ncbi:MAG: hypothetical protein ACK4UK_05825 [Flavobacterium sp.]
MTIDISNWFIKDEFLFELKIGDNLEKALPKIQINDFTFIGTPESGYFQNKMGIRIGFSNQKVDEIGVLFDNDQSIILFKNQYVSFNFRNKKIHEVLNFLNDTLILWSPIESSDTNYLMIKLKQTSIVLIFDIFEGVLTKIVKSDLRI